MYKKITPNKTSLKRNQSYKGERIEQKVNRIVNNKEPIKDGAPQIFTERKDGVNPAYDIRTDRFELALEKMDYVSKTNISKRTNKLGEEAKKNMDTEKKTEDGGTPASTQDNK